MRCEQHGLAAGPGGTCVVCLREARERAERRVRRLTVGLVVSVSLACGALLVARLLRGPLHAESLHAESLHAESLHAESLPRVAPLAVASTPSAREATGVEAVAEQRAPVDLPLTGSALTDAALTNAPLAGEPAADASTITPASALSAVAAAERSPSVRVPSKRELMDAIHSTPVSMFSTSWCPHCRRARRFFQAYGVSVVDHDIDADAEAAAELARRSGGKAVPLIDVDGRQLKGFDERATMEAVVASVERRLGVTGVKLSVAPVSN